VSLATAPNAPVAFRYNTHAYTLEAVTPRTVRVAKAGGSTYTVTLDEQRTPLACECLGFYYRHACRHLHMVGRLLEQGALVPPETIVCDMCGEPTDPALAESWPTHDGGRRPVCPSCVDDIALHASGE